MIVDNVNALREHLRGQVPDAIADEYGSYVEAGEYKLAVEALVDALSDNDVPITADLAAEIWALMQKCKVDRISYDDLQELVRG